jgi:ATP-dependent Lon protease
MVLLPGVVAPLDVGRPRSARAIDAAMAASGRILIVPQLDPARSDPDPDQLLRVGVVAEIEQFMRLSAQRYTVVVRGEQRMLVDDWVGDLPHLAARVREVPEPTGELPPEAVELVATARSYLAQIRTSRSRSRRRCRRSPTRARSPTSRRRGSTSRASGCSSCCRTPTRWRGCATCCPISSARSRCSACAPASETSSPRG